MDAKASAKSKRAHTLQAKRAHSNQNPKNPTNPNKPQKQKNPDKTLNPKSHLLPSNWHRYDDDEVFGNEGSDKSLFDARLAQGIAAPKSKGADFSELIAQAKEDARSRINPDQDFFGSVDDVFSDFYQGVSSMLSVKGNSLLSCSMDDNFIVDDSETSSYEASFLSLDLHALAAQLEKVDVSERLFIESDLLADELGVQLKETCSSRSNYGETSHEGRENRNLGYDHGETSYAVGIHNMEKTCSNNNELVLSPSTSNDNSQEVHDEKPFPPFTWHSGKPNPATDSELFHQNAAREVLKPKSQVDATAELKKMTLRSGATPAETELDMLLNTINEKETKTLGFEAATAEAELDMLLDSFGETKLLNSVDISEEQSSNFPRAQYESSTTSLKESSAFLSTQLVREVPDSFTSPSMTDALDSSIDDLLAQTPIVSNQDHGVHHPLESLTSKGLPSSSPGPKGLDDFDSWLDTL
ncbi:hypothetical protein AAC387_Pa09g0264 [Persea americana]